MKISKLPECIFLLHIDQNRLFREGLRWILNETRSEVKGEASSISEGVELISSVKPHMIIVDTNGSSNLLPELINNTRSFSTIPRVVMLTDTVALPRLANALSAELDGYLLKEHFNRSPQAVAPAGPTG